MAILSKCDGLPLRPVAFKATQLRTCKSAGQMYCQVGDSHTITLLWSMTARCTEAETHAQGTGLVIL